MEHRIDGGLPLMVEYLQLDSKDSLSEAHEQCRCCINLRLLLKVKSYCAATPARAQQSQGHKPQRATRGHKPHSLHGKSVSSGTF